MWKLEIGTGDENPLLFSTNNFLSRQIWKFYPDLGTSDELHEIQLARENYTRNRFQIKASSDIFKDKQLIKENKVDVFSLPKIRIGENEEITKEKAEASLRKAVRYCCAIQAKNSGHWPSEFSGELFLMPPLIICLYISKTLDTVLSNEHKKEMIRYIYNHQNEDGGWGLHVEGESIMLCTTLNYIALRLLGQQLPDEGQENALSMGQKWILAHGGAVHIQAWGTIYLSVLGVYEWTGCNPVPPEIIMIPSFLPFSPDKLWCLLRSIYNPVAYLYGKKFVGPITDMVVQLRKELYIQPYNQIDWDKARYSCLKADMFVPRNSVLNLVFDSVYYIGERLVKYWPFSKLREKALERLANILHYEDVNTRFLSFASLEKALNMLACLAEDPNPNQEAFQRHLARVPDYLWIAEDGMKVQNMGTNVWDTVFYVQAIIESGLTDEYGITLKKANEFIQQAQIKQNPHGDFKRMFRNISKGAWPMGDRDQGWQTSDSTSESLTTLLLLSQMRPEVAGDCAELQLLYDTVDFLLSLHNKINGGFSVWEPGSPHPWLEVFNPTETFPGVAVEYEYPEVTGSILESLVLFKKLHPEYKKQEIEFAVTKAVQYIENTQNSDGSWYGTWGICHTYAAFFTLRGLASVGKTYENSTVVRKGCEFLLSKQLNCGGWGESYLSCINKKYVPLEGNKSNMVQTAWAMIGLLYAKMAKSRDAEPIHKAARLLINSQLEGGQFPQQEITGVFMKSCVLHFSVYRYVFPLWALGLYKKHIY